VAALATVAAGRTGNSTAPAALNDGYALALCCAAGLFAVATVVAATVLPATRRASPMTDPEAEMSAGFSTARG
jgi:hypothetical protein